MTLFFSWLYLWKCDKIYERYHVTDSLGITFYVFSAILFINIWIVSSNANVISFTRWSKSVELINIGSRLSIPYARYKIGVVAIFISVSLTLAVYVLSDQLFGVFGNAQQQCFTFWETIKNLKCKKMFQTVKQWCLCASRLQLKNGWIFLCSRLHCL